MKPRDPKLIFKDVICTLFKAKTFTVAATNPLYKGVNRIFFNFIWDLRTPGELAYKGRAVWENAPIVFCCRAPELFCGPQKFI